MSEDLQNSSLSDINWTSSERPVVSIISAAVGAAGGYIAGLQGLLWHARQPLTQLREVPLWVYHLVRVYGPILPMPWGWVPITLAGVAGIAMGIGGWMLATRQNIRHIRGLRIVTSAGRAARSFRPFQGKLKGVLIHPQVAIGEHQETSHIFFLGGAGSGKTTLLWPLLLAIIARGDRVLLLDFKGDFTRGLTCPFTLLSPADARSSRWLLGRDIRTRLDAFSFAETMIPLPQGDPIWAQGARGLLIGLLSHLQSTKGEVWGFRDLAEIAAQVLVNYRLLVSIIIKEHPPAKAYLMGADSKTTASFLGQLAGALTHAIELGVADYSVMRKKKYHTWSVRDWLDPEPKLPRVAVIGWSPDSNEFSQAWASSIVEQATRQMTKKTNVNPNERRVWFFLDEVAQMGRVPSVTNALVTLRSKGVRVLFALQSVAQLEQTFDRHVLSIWAGSCATKILCSLGSEQDQNFGHKLLGKRDVERYTYQTTQSNGAVSRSGSWQKHEEDVMKPSQLGYKISPDAKGVKALIVSRGKDTASLLRWPFYSAPEMRDERKDASWLLPGYKRPVWGESPASVADVPADDTERLAPLQNPTPDISLGTKAESAKEPDPKAPTQTPGPVDKPAPKKDMEKDESDPFGEIVGGAIADAILPGASIALDALNVGAEATSGAESAPTTPIPTLSELEAGD
ncbi:type IV secretion system DNA-binding domain-containing protein [Acidiferrobacter sp.]